METKNAVIQSTQLGKEDHGIMSFMLTLDYGGSGQGAGGYALDTPIKKGGKFVKRIGSAAGMSLIMAVLQVVGVENWEDLPGKNIRVRSEHAKVHAIGHFLNDEWLDFKMFWDEIKPLIELIEEE